MIIVFNHDILVLHILLKIIIIMMMMMMMMMMMIIIIIINHLYGGSFHLTAWFSGRFSVTFRVKN